MIESLAEHGVIADDLVPALMTTHTVANPEYDPEEARRKAENFGNDLRENEASDDESISDQTLVNQALISPISEDGNKTPTNNQTNPKEASPAELPSSPPPHEEAPHIKQVPVTTKVLKDTSTAAIPGVTTSLSSTDENVTLDIRWTVLCDLFLILIADSVYDARSRVLLEQVALKLGLGWLDVVKFESRVTEALEIQEDVETLEQEGLVEGARKAGNKRRYMMLGLATLGMSLFLTNVEHPQDYDTKYYRWWPCYWSLCRSPRTCYRTWFSGSSFDSRSGRNRSLSRRNSRCRSDHHRWCSDRLRNCSSWYDQSDAASEDL